jgi:cytochrome P450
LQRARIDRLEPALRAHARRELRPLLDAGTGDFASGFGSLFPAWVTSEWLNLDPEIAPVLARTASEWVDGWRRQDGELVTARSEQMYDIARSLVADRSAAPRAVDDDPASSLLAERDEEGRGLEPDQIVAALRQSLVVGMVAPPILLGAIVLHLARDRELQDRLRAELDLIPAAVEEFVRLYSPYRGFARTVSRPVEIAGRLIEPGEPVTLAYAAANRDPDAFASPSEFRLDRPNIAQHLGFGRGRHACVGMPLARLSLQVGLSELLAATSWFDAEEPPGTGARMPEVGPTAVPIRLAPAASAADAADRGTLEAP